MRSEFSVKAACPSYISSGKSMSYAYVATVSTGKISTSSSSCKTACKTTIATSSSKSSMCSVFSMSDYVRQMVYYRWLMIYGWW